jgi:hypothetical protein
MAQLLSVNVGHSREIAWRGTEPLEAPAVGNVLTCCSRPREDLVIDI